MKSIFSAGFGAFAVSILLAQNASAQTVLLNSWENSVEGWGIAETNWSSAGFSTTTGVTQGSYSWALTAGVSPDYGTALGGPASTALTTLLGNAVSVSFDVNVPGGASGTFGYYLQFDLAVNQQGGIGFQSTDGYTYSQAASIGGEKTLTFTIPSSISSGLAAHPGVPTSLNLLIGGGGGGTLYLDNLVATVPEPQSISLLAAAGLLLARVLRRRSS